MEHNFLRHPYTLTTTTFLRLGQITSSSHATEKRRSLYVVVVVRSTIPIFTAAPTYVYSHIYFHKIIFKNFLGPFRGPSGLEAHIFESLSSRHLPLDLFPPLHLIFNQRFYSGTPNLQRHPYSKDIFGSPPRVTYPTIISRLSTSILTKGFTQALPISNVTPTPTPRSDPLHALRTSGTFPAFLPRF